jgi:hypothetical protein
MLAPSEFAATTRGTPMTACMCADLTIGEHMARQVLVLTKIYCADFPELSNLISRTFSEISSYKFSASSAINRYIRTVRNALSKIGWSAVSHYNFNRILASNVRNHILLQNKENYVKIVTMERTPKTSYFKEEMPIQLPLRCSHQCTPQWTHRLTHRAANPTAPASILAPRPACPILATCINCISCL